MERVAKEASSSVNFVVDRERNLAGLSRLWIDPELMRLHSAFAASTLSLSVSFERNISFR